MHTGTFRSCYGQIYSSKSILNSGSSPYLSSILINHAAWQRHIGARVRQSEMPFESVTLATGQHRSLFAPEGVARRREHVAEGWLRFDVSSCRCGLSAIGHHQCRLEVDGLPYEMREGAEFGRVFATISTKEIQPLLHKEIKKLDRQSDYFREEVMIEVDGFVLLAAF